MHTGGLHGLFLGPGLRGAHTTAISKIESANRAPRFPTIVILAEAFNMPAGRLFDRIP